jgi:hypothetical protein
MFSRATTKALFGTRRISRPGGVVGASFTGYCTANAINEFNPFGTDQASTIGKLATFFIVSPWMTVSGYLAGAIAVPLAKNLIPVGKSRALTTALVSVGAGLLMLSVDKKRFAKKKDTEDSEWSDCW